VDRFAWQSPQETDLSALLRSSLLCESPCTLQVRFTGLRPGLRYRFLTYHHSISHPRRGCQFTLQYSGNNKASLKQHEDGQRPLPPLRYQETTRADSTGSLTMTLVKLPHSAHAHMNLNGFEIEEVSEKRAILKTEAQDCRHVDHKEFGDLLSLQECTDAVDGDFDCSEYFSWCPSYQGRCRCATALGNAPDCSVNASVSEDEVVDGTTEVERLSCNVYKVSEVISVHFAPRGVFDCAFGSHVSEHSCLDAARHLLEPGQKLKSRFLSAGSWGPTSKGQPPHGCSLSGSMLATFNRGYGTTPPESYRLICFGSPGPSAESEDDLCSPGWYNPDRRGDCEQCNGGYTRRRRSTECTPCRFGFFDAGNFDECARCRGGETRRRRAVECTECGAGLYDTSDRDDCQLCIGGSVRRRRAEFCDECLAGSYDPGNIDDCAQCHDGHTRRRRSEFCTPCPAGYQGALGRDDCLQCLDWSSGTCKLHAEASPTAAHGSGSRRADATAMRPVWPQDGNRTSRAEL